MNNRKKNYRLIIFNTIALLILVFIQLGFLTGLPLRLANLNLTLVALVFILVLTDLEVAFYWAIGFGFFSDLFSFYPFGSQLLSFCLTLSVIDFLLDKFFTNRSFYSFLALITAATVIYNILLLLIGGLLNLISGAAKLDSVANFWIAAGSELVYNLVAAAIIYYLQNYLSNRLKPVFLQKYNSSIT